MSKNLGVSLCLETSLTKNRPMTKAGDTSFLHPRPSQKKVTAPCNNFQAQKRPIIAAVPSKYPTPPPDAEFPVK